MYKGNYYESWTFLGYYFQPEGEKNVDSQEKMNHSAARKMHIGLIKG